MKKPLLFCCLWVLAILCFYKPTEAQSLYKGKKIHDRFVRVKFKRELTNQLDQLLTSKSKPGGVIEKSRASSYLKTNLLPALDQLNAKYSATTMKRVFRPAGKFEARHRAFGLHLWYEIAIDEYAKVNINDLIEAYGAIENVVMAEPVYEKSLSVEGFVPKPYVGMKNAIGNYNAPMSISGGTPNDPMFYDQWGYNFISTEAAWEIETGDSRVVVAIEDQGVDFNHPDLDGNMWINSGEIQGNNIDDDNNGYVDDYYGYNFGDNQGTIAIGYHGTHVGGTVAAETNNSLGVAGIAGGTGNDDGVRLMSLSCFGANSQGGFDEAFIYAADMGAVISQNSWGGGGQSVVMENAIDYFIANAGGAGQAMNGGLVVFAAGNDNSSSPSMGYPGSYESVVAVASLASGGVKSSFSNYGSWVDIAAPGSAILSTYPLDNGSYNSISGTSMACPHVSGVAALLVSNNYGALTSAQLRTMIETNVTDVYTNNPTYSGQLGSGALNAYKALTGLTPPPPACRAKGMSVQDEWIQSVAIGSFSNNSGSDGGFGNYTSQTINLAAGSTSNITLTPGFADTAYSEYWRIWIDFNGDEQFDGPGELVYDAGGTSNSVVNGTLSIPSNAIGTSTTMRIAMKYVNTDQGDTPPEPCEFFSWGEVEDYTVTITGGQPDTEAPSTPQNLTASNTTSTSTQLSWDASTDNVAVSGYDVYMDGNLQASVSTNTYTATGLSASTTYSFTVIAKDASGNTSAASTALLVTTLSDSDTEAPSAPTGLSSSNVTQTTLDLSWTASTDNIGVTGYDIYKDGTIEGSSSTTSYAVSGLTASTTYVFTVVAKDAAGNVSANSSGHVVTTNGNSNPPTGYCTANGNNVSDEWIESVVVGTINNTSGANGGYGDFTTMSTNLGQGDTETITITPGWSGTNFSEGYAVWIDYNQNASFDDAGELVFSQGATNNTPIIGSFTVPVSAMTGPTRMRIALKFNSIASSCGSYTYGEVEDYTVNIGGSQGDTEAPTAPTGLNASNTTQISVDLSWTAATDNVEVTAYDIYKDGSLEATSSTTSYTVSGLTASTSYTFHVIAKDAAGNESASSNVVSVTTQGDANPPSGYCEGRGNNVSDEWIENVSFGSINNTSGANGGYADFTSYATDLIKGSSESISINAGWSSTNYSEGYAVWIDYNQNGSFSDAGELVFSQSATNVSPVTGTISVPSSALTGSTRMRIALKFNDIAEPCETYLYGEVEDYTVNITEDMPPAQYCDSNGNNVSDEWIDHVALGTMTNTTGADGGYADYTHLIATVNRGSTQSLYISTGYSGTQFTEYWNVWIDFNRDGDFDDAGENVVSGSSNTGDILTKTFTVPATATLGNTRMRVSMKFNSGAGPCDSFTYGEVEDYTVNIVSGMSLFNTSKVDYDAQELGWAVAPAFSVYPNPTAKMLYFNSADFNADMSVQIFDLKGAEKVNTTVENITKGIDISSLPKGMYLVKVFNGRVYFTQKLIKK